MSGSVTSLEPGQALFRFDRRDIRRQAIAEANAQIVEQYDDIHRLMVARLGRL
jgi:multidrug resistance efflux pump